MRSTIKTGIANLAMASVVMYWFSFSGLPSETLTIKDRENLKEMKQKLMIW